MLAGQTGEFKHRHFVFAQNGLQFCIAQDVALVGRVLQIVRLDVFPQPLDDFRTGQRIGTYDCRFWSW